MAENQQDNLIVVKKIKKGGHGHHGGAWKIAFADFVTAMMAFFLLMWLLNSTPKPKLAGISEYFKTPLRVALSGGEGVGDRTSVIKGGGNDLSAQQGQVRSNKDNEGSKKPEHTTQQSTLKSTPASDADITKKDFEKLKELQQNLKKSFDENPVLQEAKKQITMEITPEGLRILIVDAQNRPMFKTGNAYMEKYLRDIFVELGKEVNKIPNKISISGYTDATPYGGNETNYDNWNLSTDRANSARRELIQSGVGEEKFLRVIGLGPTMLLKPEVPSDPSNRRISILVVSKNAEKAITESLK